MIEFPSLGKLEAFTTSGGTSTCPWTFKGKLKVFQNKTLRYPGSYAQLKTMRDLGLFSEREIKVGGVKVAPRRVLQALYEPHVKLTGEKDVVALRVRCVGRKDDRPAEVTVEMLDYYDDETGFSAMERTTGWSASMDIRAHIHASDFEHCISFPLQRSGIWDRSLSETATASSCANPSESLSNWTR